VDVSGISLGLLGGFIFNAINNYFRSRTLARIGSENGDEKILGRWYNIRKIRKTDRLRIAFAGAGGVGKGTLGEMLTKELDGIFIPSHISETGKMIGLKDSFLDNPSDELRITYQWSIMIGQMYQERAATLSTRQALIFERSVVDYLGYLLNYKENDILKERDRYIEIVTEWTKVSYDVIIYMKPDFTPLDSKVNTWKERGEGRGRTGEIILSYLKFIKSSGARFHLLEVGGSIEERFDVIKNFIKSI